jgi:hypothetical protein
MKGHVLLLSPLSKIPRLLGWEEKGNLKHFPPLPLAGEGWGEGGDNFPPHCRFAASRLTLIMQSGAGLHPLSHGGEDVL